MGNCSTYSTRNSHKKYFCCVNYTGTRLLMLWISVNLSKWQASDDTNICCKIKSASHMIYMFSLLDRRFSVIYLWQKRWLVRTSGWRCGCFLCLRQNVWFWNSSYLQDLTVFSQFLLPFRDTEMKLLTHSGSALQCLHYVGWPESLLGYQLAALLAF